MSNDTALFLIAGFVFLIVTFTGFIITINNKAAVEKKRNKKLTKLHAMRNTQKLGRTVLY